MKVQIGSPDYFYSFSFVLPKKSKNKLAAHRPISLHNSASAVSPARRRGNNAVNLIARPSVISGEIGRERERGRSRAISIIISLQTTNGGAAKPAASYATRLAPHE